MSGIEPVLIGAAIGAGTSTAMGGDPLQGAIMGGVTGGLGSGIGGAAAGASGGAGAGLGGATTAGIGTTAGGAGAMAFPVSAAADTGMTALAGMEGLSALASPVAGLGNMESIMKELSPMMSSMGGQDQKQSPLRAPSIKQGQAPQVAGPVMSLIDERQRPQRRRLSLL